MKVQNRIKAIHLIERLSKNESLSQNISIKLVEKKSEKILKKPIETVTNRFA